MSRNLNGIYHLGDQSIDGRKENKNNNKYGK
jgi:hypothetical protein